MPTPKQFWNRFSQLQASGFSGRAAYHIASQELHYQPPLSKNFLKPVKEIITYKSAPESKEERIDRILREAKSTGHSTENTQEIETH